MTETTSGAPAVVAVVLVDTLNDEFDEVLRAIAAQDYPNVRTLVMDVTLEGFPSDQSLADLPDAVLRRAQHPAAGLGAAANEVRTLVAGSGFLWFVRGDVIPQRDTARLLLEEAYRSNVGIAGAKLVDADDPRKLLSVGYGVDKFGDTWQPVQAGELDQEQHDAVQDRFYLSSDCLLVRSDLFDSLGGFDELLGPDTMDLDLCWRAHLSGARVLVAPSACARKVVRPMTMLERADTDRRNEADRLQTVLSCYSAGHLLRVLPQAVLATLVSAVASLLSGRWRRSLAVLGAWPANVAMMGRTFRKRRAVAALRNVPDTDLRRLQHRGSARFSAVLRGTAGSDHRVADTIADSGRTFLADVRSARRWPAYATGLGLVVLFLLASRSLWLGRMSSVGHFVTLPSSPRALLRDYLSDWRPQGLGRVGPAPTGVGLLGGLGVITFGHMGLTRTVAYVLPLLLGPIGIWRLLRNACSLRGRVVGVAVYALAPLAANAVSAGRWGGVVVYGAFPFVLHWLVRSVELDPFADPNAPAASSVVLGLRAALVLGIVVAFVPAALLAVIAVVIVLALAVVVGDVSRAGRVVATGVIGVVGAVILQLPWAMTRRGLWASIRSIPEPGRTAVRFADVLRFQTGLHTQGWFGWLLLAGPVAAILVGYGWRLPWAARFVAMTVVAFVVAWLVGAKAVPFHSVEIEAFLVPALAGVAVATGIAVSAFESDLVGHQLSWRQPVAFFSACAVVLGLAPGLGLVTDGRFRSPSTDEAALRLRSLIDSPDARVFWLGDPGSLPGQPWPLAPGFSYALTTGLQPGVDDLWRGTTSASERVLVDAVDAATTNTTNHLGQLLGPTGVRLIVVRDQRTDGTTSVTPEGLIPVLQRQLDLRELVLGDDQFHVFENQAWIPTRAQLSASAAQASQEVGSDSLLRATLAGSEPVLTTADGLVHVGPVAPGEIYLASSAAPGWQLMVDGQEAKAHPAFGWAQSFTVASPGTGRLSFSTSSARVLWVAGQLTLWLATFVLATGLRLRLPRRSDRGGGRLPLGPEEIAFDIGDSLPVAAGAVPSETGEDADVAAVEADDDRSLSVPTTSIDTSDSPGELDMPGVSWASDRTHSEGGDR